MSADKKALFKGLKDGDSKSIQEIYDTVFPKVQYWILNHGGTIDDAHDIFQETLENVLLKINEVKTSFEGLLMQIAKHKWYDRIRKNKRRGEVRFEDDQRHIDEVSIEDEYIEKEKDYLKYKLLEESFNQLSDLCRQLMTMIRRGAKVENIVTQLSFSSANTMYRRKSACMERWSILTKEHASYKAFIQ